MAQHEIDKVAASHHRSIIHRLLSVEIVRVYLAYYYIPHDDLSRDLPSSLLDYSRVN